MTNIPKLSFQATGRRAGLSALCSIIAAGLLVPLSAHAAQPLRGISPQQDDEPRNDVRREQDARDRDVRDRDVRERDVRERELRERDVPRREREFDPRRDDQLRRTPEAPRDRVRRDAFPPAADLGVLLAPSRGAGVAVLEVDRRGPAAEAGIRAGDYILSIDRRAVASPHEAVGIVRQMRPGRTVEVEIWRAGRTGVIDVVLDQADERRRAAFRTGPPEDEPWIGIMLSGRADEQGVELRQIHPESPAADAGLRRGDRIQALDGRRTESPEDLIDAIEDLEPGETVEFQIVRNGRRETVSVTVGSTGEFLAQMPYGPAGMDDFDGFRMGRGPGMPQHPAMLMQMYDELADQQDQLLQMLQQLQRDVRSLREEVRRLNNGAPRERPQRQPEDAGRAI